MKMSWIPKHRVYNVNIEIKSIGSERKFTSDTSDISDTSVINVTTATIATNVTTATIRIMKSTDLSGFEWRL